MLEAVSTMLTGDSTEDHSSSDARVNCAKIMLDKIIEGMKSDKDKKAITSMDYAKAEVKILAQDPLPILKAVPAPPEKREPKPDEVEIMVDAGRIKSIKNAKDNTMLQLDGKAMPWREAIGKSFTEGKVL